MIRIAALGVGVLWIANTSPGSAHRAVTARGASPTDSVQCTFTGGPNHSTEFVEQPDGTRIDYAGGGVTVNCPARDYTLTSDSAEYHEGQGRYYFLGHVHYTEPRVALTSDSLSYWTIGDSVHALSHVHAVQPNGSTLDDTSRVYYYHQAAGVRLRDQVFAPNSPTMTIAQHDSAGHPDSSIVINGTTLFMDGDSLLYASQHVVMSRAAMVSHSDSAFLDQRMGHEVTHLIGHPVIDRGDGTESATGVRRRVPPSERARPFQLKGTLIDTYFPNQKVDRIIARGDASATSVGLSLTADTIDIHVTNDHITRAVGRLRAQATDKDSARGTLQLAADTIDLRVNNDSLERAIAWNRLKEAAMMSPSENITADSIDIIMPGQQIRRMTAVRHAYATAATDSTKMKTTERDWLKGDTIVAYFDSIPANDTARKASPREIVAIANPKLWTKADSLRAIAYYHLSTGDTIDKRPAINYLRATNRITIDLVKGQVSYVKASDHAEGIYVTPGDSTKDSTKAKTKADSTGKKPPKKPPPAGAPTAPPVKPPPVDTLIKSPGPPGIE